MEPSVTARPVLSQDAPRAPGSRHVCQPLSRKLSVSGTWTRRRSSCIGRTRRGPPSLARRSSRRVPQSYEGQRCHAGRNSAAHGPSRPTVYRLLDPAECGATLDTLGRASLALGLNVVLAVRPSRGDRRVVGRRRYPRTVGVMVSPTRLITDWRGSASCPARSR